MDNDITTTETRMTKSTTLPPFVPVMKGNPSAFTCLGNWYDLGDPASMESLEAILKLTGKTDTRTAREEIRYARERFNATRNTEPGKDLAAMRVRVLHTCPNCSNDFTGIKKARYCSERCRQAAKYARQKAKVIRKESAPARAPKAQRPEE